MLIENKENLGYTGGNNVAMQYAMEEGADYLWLLNNDTVVEPDTLSKIVTTAESGPEIGLVSPVIYFHHEPEKIQFCGNYVDFENRNVHPIDKNLNNRDDFKNGENVCLWGTALLVKKNVVGKIGYLNERFFAYWEDTEYSVRALKAGYRNVVCFSAKVYHKTTPPQDLTRKIERSVHYYYYMSRNRFFFGSEYFKDLGKLPFLGKYLSYIIMLSMNCRQDHNREAADACLDGAWAAIRGIGGPWQGNIKMPGWLRKALGFLSSWHPYFWLNLLEGRFSYIFSEVLNRGRKKIF
jgi:GT2 family glycosyltransferase